MNTSKRERIIVSVGGSLIVPDRIDTLFLKRFKALILEKVQQGYSFVIVTGGGAVARRYQEAAESVTPLSPQDLDWIGIHATRINAQLMRNIFSEHAYPHILKNPTVDIDVDEPILIAGGWEPGRSTDYVATLIAKNIGATRLVNLTNTDYVYDTNPKTHPDAQKIEKTSWESFRALIPDTWSPGLSAPFDPVASKEAEAIGLEVAIIHGTRLDEFSNYLDGDDFVGTTIS